MAHIMKAQMLVYCKVCREHCGHTYRNPHFHPKDGSYIAFANQVAAAIVNSTNSYGVKSSKRTDIIHNTIANLISHLNNALECKIEYNVGNISVDICVFDKPTHALIMCINLKASQNNIAQNATNNENVKLGESSKIKYNVSDHVKIIFLDIIPIKSPYYSKTGDIKKYETINPHTWRQKNKKLLEIANYQSKKIDGIYSLFVDYNYVDRGNTSFNKCIDTLEFIEFIELIKTSSTREES
jgi:hypothetical protein